MKVRPVSMLLALAAAWFLGGGAASAQPVMNAPVVVGANVTFSWSAVGGATSYVIQAGVAPGVYVYSVDLGNVTSVTVPAPAVGTYFARVIAQPSALPSNEVIAVVTSLFTPPAVPTGLQAYRNGTGVLIAWAPGSGGGAIQGYRLRVGLTPGGAEVGVIPTAANYLAVGGGVPAQTYYLGVSAFNGASSAESPEVTLVMPAGGACDVPPAPAVSASNWGPYLTLGWSPVPGSASYTMTYNGNGGTYVGSLGFAGTATSFLYPGLPAGTWTIGVAANFACGVSSAAGTSTFTTTASSKLEPRAPDPAPGTALPTPPYAAGIVRELAEQYPGELRASCGNNAWLFRVLARLRTIDKRWGLNWKRANRGDMSQDIITYNWSADPDEDTFNTRVYDIIGGHCGPSPSWNFTEVTVLGSTGSIWTLIPYIQAGYIP